MCVLQNLALSTCITSIFCTCSLYYFIIILLCTCMYECVHYSSLRLVFTVFSSTIKKVSSSSSSSRAKATSHGSASSSPKSRLNFSSDSKPEKGKSNDSNKIKLIMANYSIQKALLIHSTHLPDIWAFIYTISWHKMTNFAALQNT